MTDHADHATSGVNASTAGATSANTANAASIDTTSGSAADAGAAASPAAGTTPAAPASHAPHEARLAAVLGNLEATGLSQMLVCDPRSIQYLTGFYVEPGERFLGLLAAAGRKPVLVRNELFPLTEGVSCRVLSFKDGEDPLELVAARATPRCRSAATKTCRALPHSAHGAQSRRRVRAVFAVRGRRPRAQGRRRTAAHARRLPYERRRHGALPRTRARRRDRSRSGRAIGRRLPRIGRAGAFVRPIVSFGANAANPHHEPDDTPLHAGDAVLFDVGCRQDGYCSDMTRTFFFRSVDERQREVYETVRRANEAACALVAPGVRFCDIDAAARSVIEEAGYGPCFTHRLGHQIGLDVHEPGDVSAAHDAPVQPGMVFSIEPGIYLPGKFGVRIEDLVLVTEDGCEILNAYPHELTVLE